MLIRAALESVLIVLSVFLALFLDEWRSEREIEARVSTARSYLVQEVKANRDQLLSEASLPYHRRTSQMLTDALGPPGPGKAAAEARMKAGAFKGVHPFRGQDAAWTSFRTAELTTRLPAEELFLLAKIYDAQDAIRSLSEVTYAGLIQPSAEMETEAYRRSQLQAINIYFSDIIPAELALLKLYDSALASLGRTAESGRPVQLGRDRPT